MCIYIFRIFDTSTAIVHGYEIAVQVLLNLFKMLQITRDFYRIMARCMPCWLVASSVTYLFIAVITLDIQYAGKFVYNNKIFFF